MRRTAADQGADRRIRPHLVELAPETEIAEGRPSAEKKGSFCEMIVEQAQHFEEAGLDLRRGCGVGADEPDPVNHPGPHLTGEGGAFLLARRRAAHPRDAPGRADLADI